MNDEVDARPDGSVAGGSPRRLPDGYEVAGQWALTSAGDLPFLRQQVTEQVTARLGGDRTTDGGASAGEVRRRPQEEVLAGMLLVATELASNAIRHGRPPTLVRLWCPPGPGTPAEVVVEAVDAATDRMPQFMTGHDNGGRGMLLAAQLALEVSWFTTEQTKHVWARLRLDDPDKTPVDPSAADVGGAEGTSTRS